MVPVRLLGNLAIGRKVRHLAASRLFEVSLICILAVTTLAVQGARGEGQGGIFSRMLSGYIEETSGAVSRSLGVYSPQLAEANSLVGLGGVIVGQGGQPAVHSKSIELATVQNSSIVAHTPISEDYLDTIGFRRNGVVDYDVQDGDTITFVASDFGVTIDSIRWANNLKGDTIRPGQKLRIPPISGVIHTVKKGDTVTIVAKRYGVTDVTIIVFNSLPQDGRLTIGDEIIVPDGVMRVSPSNVTNSVTKPLVKVVAKSFAYLPDLGSFFLWPTQGFNWGKLHGRNGVDIANSCGTSLKAAAGGTVTVADDQGWNGGYGKFIKISHDNGTESLYAHASKLLVSVGQTVNKGGTIALMGTTGRSTGCHLHFEVHGARNPLAKY